MNTSEMKHILTLSVLLLTQCANAQHIVHSIEEDDFTGETRTYVQDQQHDGAYDQLDGTLHLISDFLHWRIELRSIEKQGEESLLAIILWSPNDDTYGGLNDADIIFKFVDGSTMKTRVAHYEVDERLVTILGSKDRIYHLRCVIMLAPVAIVDGDIDESGALLNALSTKKLEAVRMYFGDGYVNFEVPDTTLFKRLLARLNALR